MTAPLGWDDADTARVYERFCRRHRRYRAANEALIAHAALAPGQQVLDVAAGTGRTSEAVLPHIGDHGRVLCVEPARAMREAGAKRLRDSRVSWIAEIPEHGEFDRVVCGAAIWQLLPFEPTLARLRSMLAPGGALVFNIPAQYLFEPDRPGGGRDPQLLELLGVVERTIPMVADPSAWNHLPPLTPRSRGDMSRALATLGLRVEEWSFDLRFTQAAFRDWLKIPPVSEGFLAGLTAAERARRLDEAFRRTDRRSWRWERWLGWTAWQPR
jgi:SAM-dependent methyltransferase